MELDRAIAELQTLVETLEREGDERGMMLLELIDAVHRPGLEALAAGNVEHPAAQMLLGMYGFAAVDDEILVEEALDDVRPYIHSHGGEVELLEVDEGVVHLRMSGSCHGCAASTMTLRRGIETTLREHYPGFREVVAHEPEQAPAPLLQIEDLRRPVFVEAATVDELTNGELRGVEADSVPVLLANVEGEVYSVRDGCPVDGRSLEGGRLTGPVLVCPWHNCAWDVRTGARADEQEGPGLAVVPVAVHDGTVRVAVNVA